MGFTTLVVGDPYAKKQLGQHWLHDQVVLHSMVRAGQIEEGATVLEIGPGTGTLTEVLLSGGANVIAVEQDDRLIGALQQKFNNHNFTVEHIDILRFDLTKLPKDYVVVANIPYYLTSKLLRILLESSNPPLTTVVLVQKEVAERVAAQPGQMSLLSVSAQYYAEVGLDMVVPAHLFTPPPKVDSQILVLNRRSQPLFSSEVNPKLFFQLVKAGFSARRKTLHNSLSAGLRVDKKVSNDMLLKAGIQPTTRPQELSMQDWLSLYIKYKEYLSLDQ